MLPGLTDDIITVTVINIEDKELVLYGHIRSNTLASVFVRKPRPQDLLDIYGQLPEKPQKAKKFVERVAKLSRFSEAETKAVDVLCSWSSGNFATLMKVKEKYENYETSDVQEHTKATVHMNQGKLARGEKLTMTSKLLVSLSKVSQEYFVKVSVKISEGEISLKTAVEEFEMDLKRTKVNAMVETLSGQDLETLRAGYPDKFTVAILDRFISYGVFCHT